jgi:hypothetical protein
MTAGSEWPQGANDGRERMTEDNKLTKITAHKIINYLKNEKNENNNKKNDDENDEKNADFFIRAAAPGGAGAGRR